MPKNQKLSAMERALLQIGGPGAQLRDAEKRAAMSKAARKAYQEIV